MIENSEKLKSASETRAAALADKLVPYSLAGHRRDLRADRNATRGDLDPDGRFFLCAQAVDAAGRAVRHA